MHCGKLSLRTASVCLPGVSQAYLFIALYQIPRRRFRPPLHRHEVPVRPILSTKRVGDPADLVIGGDRVRPPQAQATVRRVLLMGIFWIFLTLLNRI